MIGVHTRKCVTQEKIFVAQERVPLRYKFASFGAGESTLNGLDQKFLLRKDATASIKEREDKLCNAKTTPEGQLKLSLKTKKKQLNQLKEKHWKRKEN